MANFHSQSQYAGLEFTFCEWPGVSIKVFTDGVEHAAAASEV